MQRTILSIYFSWIYYNKAVVHNVGSPRTTSGPQAAYLWPPSSESFTVCFGLVRPCKPKPGQSCLVTIRDGKCQQCADSLSSANSTFVLSLSEFANRYLSSSIVVSYFGLQWHVPSSPHKEKWAVKICNSETTGLYNLHSFSLQPSQDGCA